MEIAEDLDKVRDRIIRMMERINASTQLPRVEDRDQEIDLNKLLLPIMDTIMVLQRGLRDYAAATPANRHGLTCRLNLAFNANLFYSTNKIYTNKGCISF